MTEGRVRIACDALAWLLACWVLVACERGKASSAWAARYTDSAGVKIVTLSSSGGRLRTRDYTKITAIDRKRLRHLTTISNGVLMGGERAVVASARDGKVSGIDTAGRVLFTVGRRGNRTGEFQSLRAVFAEDTVFSVYDNAKATLTRFRMDGTVLGAASTLSISDTSFGPGQLIAIQGNGKIFEHVKFPPLDVGVVTPRVRLIGTDGKSMRNALGPLMGTPAYIRKRASSVRALPLPFSRRLVVFKLGDAIGVVDTELPEVRVFDHNLRLRSLIRFEVPRIEITPTDLSNYSDSVVRRYRDKRVREATREDIQKRPVPVYRPAIASVLGTTHGELWVMPQGKSTSPGSYIVLSSGHDLCCEVHVPKGSTLLDASEHGMLLTRGIEERESIEIWVDMAGYNKFGNNKRKRK